MRGGCWEKGSIPSKRKCVGKKGSRKVQEFQEIARPQSVGDGVATGDLLQERKSWVVSAKGLDCFSPLSCG